MSREVDQRIVELQFNNTNFEKNTKKSISDDMDKVIHTNSSLLIEPRNYILIRKDSLK